jgi:hypothetical protein
MVNNFIKRLTSSFHDLEAKDYGSICGMLDECDFRKMEVAVIANDAYLLTLMFAALIRYPGIQIHILNPAEGTEEMQRLLYVIQPDYVIVINETMAIELSGCKKILVNGETISNKRGYYESVGDTDFTLFTYSPYPTKVNTISSGMFKTMVYATIEDIEKFHLSVFTDHGLIPFMSNNSDYLLYYVAIKMCACGSSRTLPSGDDIEIVTKHRDLYLEHNDSHTMFIPKREFNELWAKNIVSLFENKFIFRSQLNRQWLVNILVRRRLKAMFKGFKNVLIIGSLDNDYMVHMLKNLSFAKVYSIFPNNKHLMYGLVSSSLDSIVLSANEHRQDMIKPLMDNTKFKSKPICIMGYRLFPFPDDSNVGYIVTDYFNRFVEGDALKGNEDQGDRRQFFHLGNVENSFVRKDGYIFPETLERVINSYPFIKSCVLLTFEHRMILVIHPHEDVLMSNRINRKMFCGVIQQQIDTLNKELPESYKIQGFVITTNLIEQDRDGEVVRFPFNYCNKR